MKIKFAIFSIFLIFLSSCAGVGSKGFFGTGVSVAFDPRSVGTQIDDSIMEKNFTARMLLKDKKYYLFVNSSNQKKEIYIPELNFIYQY